MPRHLFFAKEPSLLFADPPPADATGADAATFDVKIPQWVHILPKPDKDGLIYSRDNRVLHIDSLDKLAARSNAALKKQGGGGPVDADHRIYGWPGGGAALGWAEEFEVRPSGLFARTEWLNEGKDLIGNKLYRYTSSVVNGTMEPEIDEQEWSITWHITPDIVEGFAITNIPALTTKALFSQSLPLGLSEPEREEALHVLLRKMGLSANASPVEIREAWSAISKRLAASLSVPAKPLLSTEPEPAPAPTPAPEPGEGEDEGEGEGEGEEEDVEEDADAGALDDDDALEKPAGSLEAQLAAAKARIQQLEELAGIAFVDELVHSGKLSPAQKPAALAQAKTARGLDQLRALYENAPTILPTGAPSGPPPTRSNSTPPGISPLAYELAGKKEPAHIIARRLREQAAKENA